MKIDLKINFVRKPVNLVDLQDSIQKSNNSIEKVKIIGVLKYGVKQWEKLTNNFYLENPYFSNKGGIDKDGYTNVIMIINTITKEKLFINPEGYSYARYVGLE